MHFFLDSLLIQLKYTDPLVSDQLDILFRGWQPGTSQVYQSPMVDSPMIGDPDCEFDLEIIDTAPYPPEGESLFSERSHLLPPDTGFVSIFQQDDKITIFFHDGATIEVILDPRTRDKRKKGVTYIQARIWRDLLRSGRLEDILFTGLAPFLRRKGFYLVHAFAAACSGQSILLVGPSNSGKTTAGLSLICGNWGYLANDVVLLKVIDDQIYALPSPGAIGLSAQTVNLIPGLRTLQKKLPEGLYAGKKYLPAVDIVSSWASPAPVRRICFPKIDQNQAQQLKKMSKVMTFAMLMESSADRWDQATIEDQINLMQCLSEQAEGFELRIGERVSAWSELLE